MQLFRGLPHELTQVRMEFLTEMFKQAGDGDSKIPLAVYFEFRHMFSQDFHHVNYLVMGQNKHNYVLTPEDIEIIKAATTRPKI